MTTNHSHVTSDHGNGDCRHVTKKQLILLKFALMHSDPEPLQPCPSPPIINPATPTQETTTAAISSNVAFLLDLFSKLSRLVLGEGVAMIRDAHAVPVPSSGSNDLGEESEQEYVMEFHPLDFIEVSVHVFLIVIQYGLAGDE